MESKFVFHDPSGRRWRRLRRAFRSTGFCITALLLLVAGTVLVSPSLPSLGLPSIEHVGNFKEVRGVLGGERGIVNVPFKLDRKNIKYVRSANPIVHPRKAASIVPEQPLVFGFYVNWDPASKTSLRANLQHLTHLVPEWFTLLDGKGDISDDSDPEVIRICQDARLPILGMVTNFRNGWQANDLHRVLESAKAREDFIDNLVSNAKEHHFSGMMIDFEQARSGDRRNLVELIAQARRRFVAEQLLLGEAVPADDDAYDLKALGASVDYIVPMVYDEHYQSGEPGPIASEEWFEKQLDRLSKKVPADKTVIGVGNYGYDWVIGGTSATELSFQQVVSAAHTNRAAVQWDKDLENPVLRYTSPRSGKQHEIWFLDAVTALNQIQAVQDTEFRGIGVWRLGAEDADMWNALPGRGWPGEHFDVARLKKMTSLEIVDRYGDGDILRVVDTPHDGARNVWQENDGDYAEKYEHFPSYYSVEANGPAAGEGKQIVLTFDDGPDPDWTPKILDVLKGRNVPATFFVVGVNAESFPGLVTRIYREGHLLGNHTYSHPNIATTSPERLQLELNFTQRLIEHATGRATTLFRPPYNADSEPTTADEVAPIWQAENKFHYMMIGERIDPQDWRPGVTPRQIVEEVMSERQNGHVLLLHDGGGDRSATLAALPIIIDRLRSQGYQFINLDALLNQSRERLMPLPSPEEARLAGLEGNALTTKGSALKLLGIFFMAAIYLTAARSLLFGAMAARQKLKLRLRRFKPGFAPPVSVIIAAYNEEKVIANTIDSLLGSKYPNFEIVVVDDGSTDATFRVLQQRYAGEARVRIFKQVNGGKSSALNRAISQARHEFLVALDADTIFDPYTIVNLIRHFSEPGVGAVSGNAKVGNRKKWLTRFQSIEYICGFNLDRRALDLVNAITVVAGAVGAWRKGLIQRVGGFGHDTLAEDTDVTLAIRRLGFEIRYEEAAIAYTEAPETTAALAKQRFRWAFGTLQAAWKHRDALFRPKYGALAFIALPGIWIFQVLLAALSPLAEIAMLMAFISGNWPIVALYYAAFLSLEVMTALLAYTLEGQKPVDLLLFIPQRLYYRVLMNYVLVKSFIFALRGRLVGWNKLERTASVKMAA
jgi:cellulose synthase/poly-beta-1,6-N-acetylglucosamine synthase-like glycosyltransferase/spore germination protein YaaH/peptidoglycan/xylan/chitin deacetylase (PgdA/CDA1 family)